MSRSTLRHPPNSVFVYRAITFYGQPFQVVLLTSFGLSNWTISISLAATKEISIDFFSSGYLDVSVLQVRLCHPMYSDGDTLLTQSEFTHSDIPGSKFVCLLTEAFRRLLRPSSPYAA